MSGYLLDTNVLSELRKGARANVMVRRWVARVDEEDLYLSVLSIGEIRRGIERARSKDPVKANALEKWLAAVRRGFVGRLLTIDEGIAEAWGTLGAERPRPTADALIAATALIHRLTVVTRNTKDFLDCDIPVLNPFEA